MGDLAQNIRSLQRGVSQLTTFELISHLAGDMTVLEDAINALELATSGRYVSPEGEAQYASAFGDMLTITLSIAVAATEASLNRGAAWTFTEDTGTEPVSLN